MKQVTSSKAIKYHNLTVTELGWFLVNHRLETPGIIICNLLFTYFMTHNK